MVELELKVIWPPVKNEQAIEHADDARESVSLAKLLLLTIGLLGCSKDSLRSVVVVNQRGGQTVIAVSLVS